MQKTPISKIPYHQNQTYRIERPVPERPPSKLLAYANVVGTLIKIRGKYEQF